MIALHNRWMETEKSTKNRQLLTKRSRVISISSLLYPCLRVELSADVPPPVLKMCFHQSEMPGGGPNQGRLPIALSGSESDNPLKLNTLENHTCDV